MIKTYWMLLLLLAVSFSSCQTKPTATITSNNQSASQAPSPVGVTRPLLTAEVKSVSLYPVPGQPENLAISLFISVRNSAIASTATKWKVEVFSGLQSETFEPVRVNGVVDLPGTDRTVDLSKDDLAIKTAENPIPRNTPVEGVLTIVVPQTSEKEVIAKKTSLRVHFQDNVGNSYQTQHIVVGEKVALQN